MLDGAGDQVLDEDGGSALVDLTRYEHWDGMRTLWLLCTALKPASARRRTPEDTGDTDHLASLLELLKMRGGAGDTATFFGASFYDIVILAQLQG